MNIRRTETFIELIPADGMQIATADLKEKYDYAVYLPTDGVVENYIEVVRPQESEVE